MTVALLVLSLPSILIATALRIKVATTYRWIVYAGRLVLLAAIAACVAAYQVDYIFGSILLLFIGVGGFFLKKVDLMTNDDENISNPAMFISSSRLACISILPMLAMYPYGPIAVVVLLFILLLK